MKVIFCKFILKLKERNGQCQPWAIIDGLATKGSILDQLISKKL